MKTCIYLRKSRADEELEKTLGDGETLLKHRKALLKYAKENNLDIVDIKEELVSGDSLFFRPRMQELLKEVENKQYDGVLVMDIDRLGRGGMKDQGTILDAFKESHTLIITPGKTYDLDDDSDEEMTEFKTFFARRELKAINKRMQGGRIRSVQDGNYIGSSAPYGYDIDYIGKCRTLRINETEGKVVKIIFEKYCEGNGSGAIANYLNSLGYKTKTGNRWERTSIVFILKNQIYIGNVTWKKKEIKKSKDPNKVKEQRTRDVSEWIIAKGKHKPIIDMDTWEKAQEIINSKYHIPYQIANGPSNPLAGIIVCGKCGSKMVGRPYKDAGYRLICKNRNCDNVSSKYEDIEKALVEHLDKYFNDCKVNISKTKKNADNSVYEHQLNTLNKELQTLNEQKLKLFDLLERGIYDEKVFVERSNNLNERIGNISDSISNLESRINKNKSQNSKNDIVKFEKILDGYKKSKDVSQKNMSIKSLVYKVEYIRESRSSKDFMLNIFPKFIP